MAVKSGSSRLANGAIAALLAIFLLVVVGTVLWEFMSAFFIAIIGYVFLNPVYKALRKKGIGKTASAWATLIFGVIVMGIPSLILLQMIFNEAAGLLNPATISALANQFGSDIGKLSSYIPGFDASRLGAVFSSVAIQAANFLESAILGGLQSAGKMALGLLIILFTFYYLLTAENSLGSARDFIPLSRKNTDVFIREFRTITRSVIVTTILMAIIQAVPITLAFMYFGVPGAVLLGLIAAMLTCIPFTGIPVVWIPVALFEALGGDMGAATGILVVGIAIAIIENFRPVLQGKVGQMHPMVSLLGVVVGVPYFGMLGVLIGPILLSFALLSARMFKEEYL